MSTLDAAYLLDAWEIALGEPPALRLLALLSAVESQPVEVLAQLSIGQRDAHLLVLREKIFGKEVTAVARCPQCDDYLELNFQIDDVRLEPTAFSEPLAVHVDGCEILFRMPNSLDLHAASGFSDMQAARQFLLERCILAIALEETALALHDLPPHIMEAVTQRMAEVDPQAEIILDLVCQMCGRCWEAQFDIASFLWRELNNWAQHILYEVYQLARCYGWREADILNMSALRRQLYLQMVGGP